jgi:hypothetical protein
MDNLNRAARLTENAARHPIVIRTDAFESFFSVPINVLGIITC